MVTKVWIITRISIIIITVFIIHLTIKNVIINIIIIVTLEITIASNLLWRIGFCSCETIHIIMSHLNLTMRCTAKATKWVKMSSSIYIYIHYLADMFCNHSKSLFLTPISSLYQTLDTLKSVPIMWPLSSQRIVMLFDHVQLQQPKGVHICKRSLRVQGVYNLATESSNARIVECDSMFFFLRTSKWASYISCNHTLNNLSAVTDSFQKSWNQNREICSEMRLCISWLLSA